MTKVKVQIPDAYTELFERGRWRYKVYYGGRGKGASWNYARALLILVVQNALRVACLREYQVSIRDSVHRLLADQIERLGLGHYYSVTKEEIRCINGGLFLFKGIRNNPAEIKSMEGIDIAWLTEAENTTNDSLDILFPTIRTKGSEIWIDFNPDDEAAPTYERFVTNDAPADSMVKKVSWRDNPFFPDVLRKEMEWIQAHDADKYAWIWEGNPRRISEALVFSGRYRVEAFEEPPEDTRLYFGADWGFAQDPSTLSRSFVLENTLYVSHEVWGIGVEIEEHPALFASVPDAERWPIPADSARPELISYMQRHGFPKLRAVKKGPGSVEDGVAQLLNFDEIVVHPRCRHHIEEFGTYSYKIDKRSSDVLPIIVDATNHCMDALRYAHFVRAKRAVEVW